MDDWTRFTFKKLVLEIRAIVALEFMAYLRVFKKYFKMSAKAGKAASMDGPIVI